MKKYKVTLIMSEEYTIEADNPEDAEAVARDKFGNNYLIDDVEVKEILPKRMTILRRLLCRNMMEIQ